MQDETKLQQLEVKYHSLVPLMDERMRRQWAAAEARAYGWGGVRAVSGVIGMSPNTISKGLANWRRAKQIPMRRWMIACAGRVGDANGAAKQTQSWWKPWNGWSSR